MSTIPRKVRKLQRDPRGFFTDLVANRARWASEHLAPQLTSGAARLLTPCRSAAEILLDGPRTKAKVHVLCGAMFDRRRPAYLRVHEVDLAGGWDPSELFETDDDGAAFPPRETREIRVRRVPGATPGDAQRQLFDIVNSAKPHGWPIAELRGYLLAVDPSTPVPFVLRSCWPRFRLITVLGQTKASYAWDPRLLDLSDVVIQRRDALRFVDRHRYQVELGPTKSLRGALDSIVRTLEPTQPDPLVPIKPVAAPLPEGATFDGVDVLLLVDGAPSPATRYRTFRALVEARFEEATGVFVRQSVLSRYASHLHGDRLAELLLEALRHGARLDVRRTDA